MIMDLILMKMESMIYLMLISMDVLLKAAPDIPMGNPKTEWMRSNPDIVLFKPQKDEYDNDNGRSC